jgi:hypothetical protein
MHPPGFADRGVADAGLSLCLLSLPLVFYTYFLFMSIMAASNNATESTPTSSDEELRNLTQKAFGKCACLFQLDVAHALLAGQDVINLAATGLGKTLSFWIPLLHWKAHKKPGEPEKIVLVVTPLNILGGQNEAILKEAGILGIAIDGNDIGDGTIWNLCVLVWPNTHMLIIFPEN